MDIGIGIRRGRTMDRKLHVDTLILILIPTLKIYVFWYSGQTDRQMEKLIQGGGWVTYRFLHVHVNLLPLLTLAACGLEELFFQQLCHCVSFLVQAENSFWC